MNVSTKELLTAGALSEGICEPQTVRKYDRLGLLKPAARDTAGRRLYDPTQRQELEAILARRIASRGFGRRD